MNLWDL